MKEAKEMMGQTKMCVVGGISALFTSQITDPSLKA
jgi:hypothetical protein